MIRYRGVMIGTFLLVCGFLSADNSVEFVIQRNGWIEIGVFHESYELEFHVKVSAQTVEVKFPSAVSYIPMEYDSEEGHFDLDWIEENEFPTLSELFTAFGIENGECRLRIDKGLTTESIYRFSIDIDPISENAFPGFPAVTNPEEGQTVGSNVTFTWTNPDGYEDFVGPWTGVEQGDSYYDGGLFPAGTSEWSYGPLANGPALFEMGYGHIVDGIAEGMTWVSGKLIEWGLADHSPDGWLPGKPLTALFSDMDIHFQVQAAPKASISFGYFQTRTENSGDYDTYNVVVRVTIPNVHVVSVLLPSLPGIYQELDWISEDTYRIRFVYSSFVEMMTAIHSGTYRIHIYDQAFRESVYRFEVDSTPVQLDVFPDYVTDVQPPRNSLAEIPTTFSWSLSPGYAGTIGLVILKDAGFEMQMLPPNTTSAIVDAFEPAWNQLVLMTTKTASGVSGPMTWESGFEIDWDQTGSVPAGWPTDVPYTYLGSEWMGAYYAIEPGQCAFRLPGDLNEDCRVSLEDFVVMAEYWLMDCRGTSVSVDCWGFL
ncbi:MAG: hypothetical protein GX455_13580 [Phycisphaerae bacterium]|nr:hypothetical protein [Phycisphaerae bacterium]